MTPADVKRQALKRFGDPGQVMIKDQDIWDFINDGQLQIARMTETDVSSTVGLLANALPYTPNNDVISILSVQYNSTSNSMGTPLPMSTREDLLAKGFDLNYKDTPAWWYSPFGNAQVQTYPKPLATDITPMTITFTRKPTDVTSGTTPLEIPAAWQPDLVTYVVSRCHEVNQNWQAAQNLMVQFKESLGQSRYESMSSDGDTYTVVRDDPYDEYYWTDNGWSY